MEHEPNKKPAIDPARIQALFDQNREIVESFVRGAREAISQLSQTGKEIKAALKVILPPIADLVNGLNGFPAEYREAMLVIANKGWYLDPDMAFDEPLQLAAAYSDGRADEADKELVEHFRARLHTIEADLVSKFPKREAILRQAFQAHRMELYYASIPTFLTLVDGVCLDITKTGYLFKKERGEKRTGVAPYVDGIADSPMTEAMLAPFLEAHAILFNEKQRAPEFASLNRHMVLHGESLDHGTEANSLRTISLLYYAARALKEFSDVKPDTPNE